MIGLSKFKIASACAPFRCFHGNLANAPSHVVYNFATLVEFRPRGSGDDDDARDDIRPTGLRVTEKLTP